MSFHRRRTILRIHYALVHLTDGRFVAETVTQWGWSNPSSFTEVVGRTPGRYQADLRGGAK
ncbi:hypothetical protein ACQP2T_30035 [Nonomuraea sp. CA-143628]|uniref:hypothetical protein n=1 Tax=Nonomuraea sp. CA-143628 TaxID=3239997 RepID=UPI003D8D2D35